MDKLIHLSAKNFIKALQGKLVKDENGIQHNFFYKSRQLVLIKGILVTEDVIIDNESLEFPYRISIVRADFQGDFFISGGIFKKKLG